MSMRRRLVPLVRALPPHCRERPPSDPRARAPAAAAPRARRCAATDAFSDSDCGDSADDGGKVALRLLLRIGAAAAIALLLIAIQPRGVDARSAGEPMRYETAYACEGKTLKIGCPEGSVIHLIRANYGRFSITICNDHGNTDWSVNCMSTKSLRVLHTRCSMNQNCSILASTNMFGDPCPNTLKYLEAHYQCMPATSSTTNRPSPPWQMTSQPSVWRSTSPSGQPKRPAPASGGHHTSAAITPPTFRPHITLPPELKPGVISKVRTDSRQPESTDSKKTPDDAKQEIPKTELPEDDTSKPKDAAQDTAPIDIPPSKGRDPIKGDVFTESPPIIQDPYEPPSERDRDRANGQDRRHHHHMTNIDDNGQSGGDLATSPPEIGVMPAAPLPTPAAACPARIARTLHWNYTIAGSVAVQPCPGGATGLARWRCVMVPSEVTYHSHNTNTMNRHRSGSSLQSGENFADLGLDIESADTLPDSNLDDGQQIVRKLKGEPLLTDGEPEPLMLPEAMASSLDSEILTGVQYTPMWHPTYPDLSECRSVWLNSLETRAREGDSMLSITSDLVQVTSSKTLYGGDMMTTSNIMKRLAQRMASNVQSFADTRQREAIVTDMLLGVVKTGSNLLDESQRASWRDLSHSAQMRAATSLLIGLEENAFLLAEAVLREKTILQQVKNILLSVRVLETRNIAEEEVFPNPNTREQWTATEDEIILPRGALIENSEGGLVRVIFVAFDRLEEILQPLQPQDLKGYYHGSGSIQDGRPGLEWARDNVTTVLNSKVISASLGKGRHIQLPQPVRLTLKHIRTENVSNPVCVFWDYTTNNWSGEGCHVVGHNETHTQCSCAHLTNFAILMDLRGGTTIPAHHRLALRVVTLVGCAISSVALVAAILVFHCFRNMKSERVMIHKNLCACLLLGELVFMFGIHQTQNRILCGVIAGFLHYFFLAAFVWMFLEAFHLYAMLVEVWQPAVSRARWYTLCGYGGPLLVVVAAALADPLSYGTTHACWLRADNMFILTFVVPVAFVLVANWICLSMVIYMMCRHSNVSLKAKDTSKLYKMRVWLKTSLVLGVILGLTWTFGLLYLNEQTVAVAYIFTVLNSLQGLFIFIFHCLQNEVFQKECGRLSSRYRWLSCCATLGVNNSSGTAASGQAAPHAATPGSSATPNNDRVPPTNQGSMKHRRYQQAHSESTEDVSEPRDGGTSYKVQPSPTRSCHMLRPTAPLYVPSQDLPHPQDYRLPKSCSVSSGRSSNLLNPGLDEWKNTSSKHSTLQHHHHGASEQIVYNQPSPQSPLHYRGHGQEESPLQPYQRIYAQSEYGRSPHATYLPANQSAQEMIYRSSQRRPKHHHPAPYAEIPGYYRSQDYRHDDPVYEEIERNETLTSDVSDDNSDVARAGERPPPKQYADHRPLISYSPGERHFASPQYEQRSKYKWEGGERPYEPRHPAFAPESNMRSLAAKLNGENVVCHLEPHPVNFYDGQTSRAVLPYGDC